MGIVAEVALGRRWRRGTFPGGYIRPDLTMYPGFSGGPLVDVTGRVAGLNSSALARGVSVALPAATVRRVDTR